MNKKSEFEELKSQINKIFQAKNIKEYWEAAENILDGSSAWDNVMNVKNEGGKKFAISLFGSFEKASDAIFVPKDEKEPLVMFGKAMKDCVEKKEYQSVARELLRMTLQHLMELYEIKNVKDPEDLSIQDDIMKNMSQEMMMPFTIFSSMVMGGSFENLKELSKKEEDKFYALVIGLWQDLQDLMITEEILATKNSKRKEQIKEFIDENRPETMDKYYDLIESETDTQKFKKEMESLIQSDPDFFDPYQAVADILIEDEKYFEADRLLKEGFKKAMMRITDYQGRWPKNICWHFMENRHLVRMLDRFACDLWDGGREVYAIELYRKLLKSNPNDNIGARYNILAISLGYDCDEVENEFPTEDKRPGFVDAIKMEKWFRKNAVDFPEEFEWWFELQENK
jgi:tetratricopeptide (TPR) repeat protein